MCKYPQLAQEVLAHNNPRCGISQHNFKVLVEAQTVAYVTQTLMCLCCQTWERYTQQKHVAMVAGAASR